MCVFVLDGCLFTGKRKCAENAKHVLKVLTDLLGHENHEVMHISVNTWRRLCMHSECNVLTEHINSLYDTLYIKTRIEDNKSCHHH